MLKRLIVVMLVLMLVVGLSGLAHGLMNENLSTIFQSGSNNVVGIVSQDIQAKHGPSPGCYNESLIRQIGNGNDAFVVCQIAAGGTSYNYQEIRQPGNGNAVWAVLQEVRAHGSKNLSYILQSGGENKVGHVFQKIKRPGITNTSDIDQTGNGNMVFMVIQEG